MLENIFRYVEAGMDPLDAAPKGVREITSAVVGITITLVAVVLPIAFQAGTTGILFREFAVATAGSVVISAFVALTLTPTLCARMLRHAPEEHGWLYRTLETFFRGLERRYTRMLGWAVRRKGVVVFAGVASFTPEVTIVEPTDPVGKVVDWSGRTFGFAPPSEHDFVQARYSDFLFSSFVGLFFGTFYWCF